MVMPQVPPTFQANTVDVMDAGPAQEQAARQRIDQLRMEQERYEAQQQQQLEAERQALEQKRLGYAQQLAQMEAAIDRGERMAENPQTQGYARGGVVPHYAQGGTTARIVGYAPNGVAIWQDTTGAYVYINPMTKALEAVPPQLIQQVVGTQMAGSMAKRTAAPAPAPPTGAAAVFAQPRPAYQAPAGSSTVPMPPTTSTTNGLVAPTPDQWSAEFKGALAARQQAEQQAGRDRAMEFGISQANERSYDTQGRGGERPGAGDYYAKGGMAGMKEMGGMEGMGGAGGPPMPPDMGTQVMGEGADMDGTAGGEVVLIPAGEPGLYRAHYVEGATQTNAPGGTLIVPLPPDLDDTFRNELPPMPGQPAPGEQEAFAHGGMVPMPPAPYVNPWAGISPPAYGNLQQMGQMTPMQETRLNQQMVAGGNLEGLPAEKRKLMQGAPGRLTATTYSS